MPGDWHPRGDKFSSSAQRRMWFARDPDAAERVAHKQKRSNKGRTVHLPGHVDKADTTNVRLPRKVHGRGRPSSRYGGTPGHGRRTEEPTEFGKGYGTRQVAKAFTPTPVLARTKPIAQLAADGGADLSPATNAAQAVNAPKIKTQGAAGKTPPLAGRLTSMAQAKPMTGQSGTMTSGGLASMGSQKPQQAMGGMGSIGSMSKALTGDSKKAVGRLALIAAGAHGARQAGDFASRHKVVLGATSGGYAGGRVGSRRHVEKAEPARSNVPVLVRTQRRSHDPERGRQFRLGAATAGTAAGGGSMLLRGGKELRRLNREHRNVLGGLEHTKLINLKGGGGVGVGIAGLVGASQLARYSAGNKNRRWT